MNEIFFDWNDKSQKDWDDLLKGLARTALQQDWAYGAVISGGRAKVRRLVVYEKDQAIAMAQIIIRSFWGLFEVALLTRGPLWLAELSPEKKKYIFQSLQSEFPKRQRKILIITPEIYTQEIYEGEQDNFGQNLCMRQIITGYGTLMLDLGPHEDQLWANLYSKNRNMIRKAEKNAVEVFIGDHNHPYTDWLLKKEEKQQKEKKYQGLPAGLVKAYGEKKPDKAGVLTVFAFIEQESQPVAGALFLLHGDNATYHIGWNGKKGRKVNALNLLLWRGLCQLKKQGVKNLDFGGVNTDVAPDIARFKLGFGGQVIRLIGTYL